MTVAELVASLKDKHPDAEVWIAHPYENSRRVSGADLNNNDPMFAFVYTAPDDH